MRCFRFDAACATPVTAFASRGVRARPLQHDPARVVATSLWLEPGAHLGRHEAPVDQLFLVVVGAGWVADAAGRRRALRAGEAAFWRGGDVHEGGSDGGMGVVVLEGEGLEPERWMVPCEGDGEAGAFETDPAGPGGREAGPG